MIHNEPPYPFWHNLTSGPYRIGFQAGFWLDTSRTYDLFPGALGQTRLPKSPRPLLLTIWYPVTPNTNGDQMPYQNYFDLPTTTGSPFPFFANRDLLPEVDSSGFVDFAQRLADHHRNNLCHMLFGCAVDQLNPTNVSTFHQFMRTETAAIHSGPPASDKFPLVVYHPGLGGGYEENSVLAEYLASHGYVVVSSAYQPANTAYLNINGDRQLSMLDIGYIIEVMQQASIIDWQHIAVMGHSYGAGVGLDLRMENDIVDTIVSLDSTMDYDKWLQPRLVDEYVHQRRRLKVPMLVVANRQAEFTLCRKLRYAERYLLSFNDFHHNDFLAHQTVLAKRLGDTRFKAIDQKCDDYIAMCRYVRWFLDATLKQNKKAFNALYEVASESSTVKQGISLEYLAADSPPPELKHLISRLAIEGATAAIRWCRSQAKTEYPLFDLSDLNIIGYELIAAGQTAEAVVVFEYMVELFPNQYEARHSLAEAYVANQVMHAKAVTTFEQTLSLLLKDETLSTQDKEEWHQEILGEIRKLKAAVE